MKRRKFIQKTTRGGTFTLLSVTGILGSAIQNLKSQMDSIRRFNAGDKSWQESPYEKGTHIECNLL